ncbi:ATP-dependent Clp protease ATP-binding subunit [Pricia sp. S334]|uniref:ATP-dependent Clp protease ATP-binding subunit n=1 Tax=Pricia mediterranea TaxID=3076079 RepID=A0ABU3LA59_9FLAO|nr:ATP-dependent Clp protease ATP-binding subunit [Pricia sp. S334]MDT7830635.1 ATP-dependent Clp protease ATP-binding subunit [Pricia sp. S334]
MNQEVEKAVHIATQLAEDYHHESFGPPHLMKALLNRDLSLLRQLHDRGIDVYFIEDWADVNLERYPKGSGRYQKVRTSSEAETVFTEAGNIQEKLNKEDVDLICLFISAITPGVGFSFDQLKALPVGITELLDNLMGDVRSGSKVGTGTSKTHSIMNTGTTDRLKKYTVDLLSEAKNGAYDIIVDRNRELKLISEILSRKSKPNVIVHGESGVGKTLLIQNLVREIHSGKVVDTLRDINFLEIDTSALLSGASYKGEVEDRLQQIFKEAKTLQKPILYIDDIHSLLQDVSASQGIINLIKSELNKGEVILIGTTTSDSYRKYIAVDTALDRRFESVMLEEPDHETTFRILKSVGRIYTEHHGLEIDEVTLRESIRLSKRYLQEKCLPDSAVDLIDRTMAAIKVSKQSLPSDIETLQAEIDDLEKKSGNLSEEERNQEIDWLYMAAKNRLSTLILGKFDSEDGFRLPDYDQKKKHLESLLTSVGEHAQDDRTDIDGTDLAAMVSNITGIPVGKVQIQERERLMDMESTLKKRVIGQDHAVQTVAEAIIESRSGLSKAGQPIGSFFFSGPTGTGKTELAKSLAEFLFNDESAILRFDMSEFKEEHSAALLYGAPPGYVGYEEGGVLVNKIRQKPYSIVLFDEIEKAHQSVFDVFLQILDEGKLSDRLGKVGDFSNAVVLFTSNIGSESIAKSIEDGKTPLSDELMKALATYFRPEFLGRITEIVPFAPISRDSAPIIFDLHLKKELLTLTERLNITLEIDKKTRDHLALDGFSPTYGVRPLKAVIRNKLKRPLSKMIISGAIQAPQTVKIGLESDAVVFTVAQKKQSKKTRVRDDGSRVAEDGSTHTRCVKATNNERTEERKGKRDLL